MLEAEKQVKEIQDRLRAAKSRQKSYYDTKHREVNFEPGDYVYLRVTPMRGVKRFQTRGKLAPRYVGPFTIMAKRGQVAYQLELPLGDGKCSRRIPRIAVTEVCLAT